MTVPQKALRETPLPGELCRVAASGELDFINSARIFDERLFPRSLPTVAHAMSN